MGNTQAVHKLDPVDGPNPAQGSRGMAPSSCAEGDRGSIPALTGEGGVAQPQPSPTG